MNPREPAEDPVVVLDRLIVGHWVAQAIAVVAELGVADRLADGPRSVEDLAAELGADAGALHRVLRALASEGVFTEVEPRRFGLTPIARLLRSDVPGSLRAVARLTNDLDWSAWRRLDHSVRTGQPAFPVVHGTEPFAYLAAHPEAGATFDEAMTGLTAKNAAPVVDAYDFSPFATIVDVGGGHGAFLTAILRAHPRARGILADLPLVVEGARARIAAAGLAERCACVPTDMFEAVPPGGDAYILSSVIHDWDEARSQRILTNCRRAMGDDARLLLVEMIIPEGDAPAVGKWLDLEMLVCFGGRERTEAEYRMLLAATGFELTRVVATSTPASVIEARPT
jgi:hypothetical protein